MRRSFGRGIRDGVRRLFVPKTGTRRRSRQDLEAELEGHLQARIEYLIARGQSPESARAEAARRFGDVDATIEILRTSGDARDRRLSAREHALGIVQDAEFVLRGLARAPAFTIGVIATLTLGLGINSAVFRMADRVLLRAPSGVSNASALRRVHTTMPVLGAAPAENATMSYPDARLIIDTRAFARAGMYVYARSMRLQDGRQIAAAYVDSGFFPTIGARPAMGRAFDVAEAEVGADVAVAVVSYDFWQRELGGVPLGSLPALTLGDRPYRVIGAMPRGFVGVDLDPVDVWLPLGVAVLGRAVINGTQIPWYRTRMLNAIHVVGRIPGVATDQRVAAQAGTALAAADRDEGRLVHRLVLESIVSSRDGPTADTSGRLVGRLAGVAIVVLLIACANAANLLLARALRRRREIAVRLALGAGRARVARLLIVESVMLGLGGAATAALAGYWTGDALRRLLFPGARWTSAAFDDRTLGFTLAAALVAGLVAGLAPALQLTHPDLVSALKDNRYQPGRRSHRTRAVLVVLQTGFSLMLLIASGLLVRSLQRLNDVNLGFDPDGLVTALAPNATQRGVFDPGAPVVPNRVSVRELRERLRHHPDVRAVALASTVPFGAHASMSVSVPGRPDPNIPPFNGPYYIGVSPNYFSVMGTRLLRGRTFSDADGRSDPPAVILGETMARLYWPDADPFASCLLVSGIGCARVVGIVEDVRDTRGGGTPPIRYYLPLGQYTDSAAAIVLRTSPARAANVAAILTSTIPAAQRPQIEVISDRVSQALRPWRLATLLFGALGAVALLLSCVGVYSVMSYIASERIHELGVRVVLGATSRDIVQLVLASGLRLVAVGAALGVGGALASAHLLASLLFGVSPREPVVYAGACLALAAIGIAATLGPALSVMRTDPTVALRSE